MEERNANEINSGNFYAHSLPNAPMEQWQLLNDHLTQTADLAGQFSSVFNSEDWGYVAGLLHDWGKFSDAFQNYLKQSGDPDSHIEQQKGKIDHSTAGAQLANNIIFQTGKLIAYIIAGHHSGLLDGSGSNGATLADRLGKEVYPVDVSFPNSLPSLQEPPFTFDNKKMGFQLFLFIKMLYSALTDADFLDTEAFMSHDRTALRGHYPQLKEIAALFWENISAFKRTVSASPINQTREDIYNACLQAAEKEPGFFSLTVPTGGGKTLSSMAFALRHAEKHHLRRIIYVIPYTSIIEQNAEVFRKYLGDDAVLEHHSNFEPAEEDYHTRLACENWDAPVIVTTTVQFYESFFANRSSACRKLHNIAQSVIVIDEVQNLPVDYLLPCIELLRELVHHYGCSIVLCSATQPAIQRRDDFIAGLKNVREIIPSPSELFRILKRVDVKCIPEKTAEDVALKIKEYSRVLCIVNTKKHAKELYSLLGANTEDNYHLSTFMCPAHRSEKFKEIREKLQTGQSCRVISTQLIEAGVDIDFPVVFRAMAGIDSIAQAAGRCNREGKLPQGEVFVFEPECGYPPGFIRQAAQEAIGVVRRTKGDLLTLDAIEEYFKNLYWVKGDNLDKKQIINAIRTGSVKLNFPFKTVAEQFRIIESNTKPVIIPYNQDARDLINSLPYCNFPNTAMRKLQKFTVQLFDYPWQTMVACGAVQIIDQLFPVLIREDLYDENLGLNIENPDKYKPEDLMVL